MPKKDGSPTAAEKYDQIHGPGAYARDVYPGHGRADRYSGKAPVLEGTREHFAATAGTLARYHGICVRCDSDIIARQHRVVPRPGGTGVIHVTCASGADDE